jgi:CDGSH-type Zn-finger protein/uncharacterized Fe-S cluster protein YjdI
MSDEGRHEVREYAGEAIAVRYEAARCIHSAECVRGLPAVFDTGRRPWIDPDGAAADQVAEVVIRCPTGALSFERRDGGAAESPPAENRGTLGAGGPLYLRGRIELRTPAGELIAEETRVALCRCGASKNKPYCDGSHKAVGFDAPAAFIEVRVDPAAADGGTLTVTPAERGPLQIRGPLAVEGAAAEVGYRGGRASFCRCGASASKPFCDGSHNRIGFTG